MMWQLPQDRLVLLHYTGITKKERMKRIRRKKKGGTRIAMSDLARGLYKKEREIKEKCSVDFYIHLVTSTYRFCKST